jgi:hypothetical protein
MNKTITPTKNRQQPLFPCLKIPCFVLYYHTPRGASKGKSETNKERRNPLPVKNQTNLATKKNPVLLRDCEKNAI